MDTTIIFIFAAVLIVAGLLFAVITMTKKGTQLDVDKYRLKWLKIEQQLKKDEPTTYNMVVLEADKLVDLALREKGVKGQTMGERMKNVKEVWSNRNAIWTAHKMRNQIAHEHDFNAQYDDTRRALAAFKQGLKDLGAI